MILAGGTEMRGKVCHIPGLFFIVTRFICVSGVPILPEESFLIVDRGNKLGGIKLKLHLGSLIMAYLRAALFLLIFLTGMLALLCWFGKNMNEPELALVCSVSAPAALVALMLTFYLSRHGNGDARKILARAGIHEDLVQELLDPPAMPFDDAFAGRYPLQLTNQRHPFPDQATNCCSGNPTRTPLTWFYGKRFYGKVDNIPGLCYVVTCFFYILFIPLVPLRAFLIFDDDDRNQGVPLRSNHLLSIAMAYLRAILALAFVGLAGALVYTIATGIGGTSDSQSVLPYMGATGGAFLFFIITYGWTCHTVDRARRFLSRAGIKPDLIDDLLRDFKVRSGGRRPRSSNAGSLATENQLPASAKTTTPMTRPQPGGIGSRFSKDTHS